MDTFLDSNVYNDTPTGLIYAFVVKIIMLLYLKSEHRYSDF